MYIHLFIYFCTSEGRHCDLPLSTKGKLYPVYTMVKIDPSLTETIGGLKILNDGLGYFASKPSCSSWLRSWTKRRKSGSMVAPPGA